MFVHKLGRAVMGTKEEMGSERRAALWMNLDEAGALVNALLSAAPTADVPDELADRLLCRIATIHRTLHRSEVGISATRRGGRRRDLPRRRESYVKTLDCAG